MEKQDRNRETREATFVFVWVSERRRLPYQDSTGNGVLRGGGVLTIVLRTWGECGGKINQDEFQDFKL